MAVKAYAPASIGNVRVGFDILGAALTPVDGTPLGDTVTIEDSDTEFSLVQTGSFVSKLPKNTDDNIVTDCFRVYRDALAAKGQKTRGLRMTLEKDLPVGSGLGSSACSVVSALAALNAFHDHALSEDEIIRLMGQEEGKISGSIHYDNVAPCYLGGIQLMLEDCDEISERIPDFSEWYWVSCYPGIVVSTAAARKILPVEYPRSTAIRFASNVGAFIHASHSGNRKLAAKCLVDVIAEPYRKSLIPGFDEARAYAMSNGGLAFGISGSGPSIFAVTESMDSAKNIESWLKSEFIQNSDGFCHICRIDRRGTVVTEC